MENSEATQFQSQLNSNCNLILQKIKAAALSVSRKPNEIELLPVSKIHTADKIKAMHSNGYFRFGENYPQEMFEKAEFLKNLSPAIAWVFIGQLQSNKIRKIVETASEIQTVSSLKHARYISRYAEEYGKSDFPIYICVNAGAEEKKGGVSPDEATELANQIISEFPNLELEGIMAIPPAEISRNSGKGEVPKLYVDIATLAKNIGNGKLSLGMTSDIFAAVGAGSTCIRVGTGIFGQRV